MTEEFEDGEISWVLTPGGWQRIAKGSLVRLKQGDVRFTAPDGSRQWLSSAAYLGAKTDHDENRLTAYDDAILRGTPTVASTIVSHP